MTSPALRMLIERLLWPIPRVRLEAARSLAALIREDDKNAPSALLDWIHARRLESEVALGLGIIDAFCLGDYFEFADVTNSIGAPSLLSDFLLKNNFTDVSGLSPTRYTTSPPEPASLHQHEEDWFDHYREEVVPPIFSSVFTQLQKESGFPFMMGWRYEWRWLLATNPRPEKRRPSFFFGARSYLPCRFHTGQRELYLSAYLRTLAFAALNGAISYNAAEFYAMYALTMNRGLAELEPVARPDWAKHLLPCDAERTKELAQNLWTNAEEYVSPGEALLALRVVDFKEDGFIEFDMTLCIGQPGFAGSPAEAVTPDVLTLNARSGEMAGQLGRNGDFVSPSFERPLRMAQQISPKALGSVHIDMALNIRLASPDIFGTPVAVECGSSEIRLKAGADVLSRWIHWYADWEPAIYWDLSSGVCSMTTVSASNLDRLRASCGMEIAPLVRVRRAERQDIRQEDEVNTEAYWM